MWNINWRTFGGRVFGRAVRVMLALCSIRVYFVCLYRPASGRGMKRECLMHVCLSVRMSVFDKWKGGSHFQDLPDSFVIPISCAKTKERIGSNWSSDARRGRVNVVVLCLSTRPVRIGSADAQLQGDCRASGLPGLAPSRQTPGETDEQFALVRRFLNSVG